MTEQGLALLPETLLAQWLQEPDRERASALLDALVRQYADPLVRRIVAFKLASLGSRDGGRIQRADVEDVCGTALYNLLARFERLKGSENHTVVKNFSGYVAATAYNACNEFFRARKPAWLSLVMKMRYLLTHSPKLALWENAEGREVCGFSQLKGREATSLPVRLDQSAAGFRRSADPSRLSASELADAILRAAGGPMTFESFVEAAAEWSGVKETQMQSIDQAPVDAASGWEQVPDTLANTEARLIGRHYMERLWAEICDLPLPHRKALLLNLNSGAGGDIQLFDHLGIASVEQIAKALELEPLRFAGLWNQLPLDDAHIAQELGISRQDVVNRRSAARKRLVRRMNETHGN